MRPSTLLLAILLLPGVAPATAPPTPPDLVLHGGRIHTGDPARPQAQALAVRGERIVAVGDDADVLATAGPATTRIDLRGHRVVAGINDAHDHLGWHPPAGDVLQLPWPDPDGAALEAALRALPRDGERWIRGEIGPRVLNGRDWSLARLDGLQPTRPIVLRSITGHGVLLNGAAARAFAVDPARAIPGGWYGRDARGGFDGRLFEYAGWSVMSPAPPADEAVIAQLRRQSEDGLKAGITTVQTMSWLPIERFVDLWRRSGAKQRVRAIRFPQPSSLAEPVPGLTLPGHVPGTRIEVSGTKWILDATPFEEISPLRAPYPDGHNGRLNFSPVEIRGLLAEALARDDQVLLHVFGDATADAAFAAMAALAPAASWRARRVRFEHGDGLSPDLLARAAEFGVVVVQNPSHFMAPPDHPAVVLIRARGFSPLADVLAAGVPLALGSDGPRDPWLNLQFATAPLTRPDQALTRAQALHAYTEGSAFAEFHERDKGRLAPGYLADLAVLSQDVLDEAAVPAAALPATRSLLTVVGGEVAWRDPGF